MTTPDPAIEAINKYMASGREDEALAYALGTIYSIADLAKSPAELRVGMERIKRIHNAVFPFKLMG